MYEDISDESFSTISQSDTVVIDEVGDEDCSRDISPARRVVDLGIWHRIRSADDSGPTTSLDVNTSCEIRVGNQSTPRLRTCQLCERLARNVKGAYDQNALALARCGCNRLLSV